MNDSSLIPHPSSLRVRTRSFRMRRSQYFCVIPHPSSLLVRIRYFPMRWSQYFLYTLREDPADAALPPTTMRPAPSRKTVWRLMRRRYGWHDADAITRMQPLTCRPRRRKQACRRECASYSRWLIISLAFNSGRPQPILGTGRPAPSGSAPLARGTLVN